MRMSGKWPRAIRQKTPVQNSRSAISARVADHDDQPIGAHHLRPCAPVTGSVHPVLVARITVSPPAIISQLGRHAPPLCVWRPFAAHRRACLPRLSQPHPGHVPVRELDAGRLQGGADARRLSSRWPSVRLRPLPPPFARYLIWVAICRVIGNAIKMTKCKGLAKLCQCEHRLLCANARHLVGQFSGVLGQVQPSLRCHFIVCRHQKSLPP